MNAPDRLLHSRNTRPYGRSWENWATAWYRWMFSIEKKKNPCTDKTGKFSSEKQEDNNVWFLAGTFGNISIIKRNVRIPVGRSILFPILVKEDSLAEDNDLTNESELIKRCRDASDKVLRMEARIDGESIPSLESYRVQTKVFDVVFPKNNVYDLPPGPTRSVCDGFWIFLRPLEPGKHTIYFKGETSLNEPFTKGRLRRTKVYSHIWSQVDKEPVFRLEVLYKLHLI